MQGVHRHFSVPQPQSPEDRPGKRLQTQPVPVPAIEKVWRLGFQDVEQEFVSAVPVKVYGRVPADLDVSLFRNGPGRFAGEQHWVDGQGFLVKIGLHAGDVHYQSRFIETAEHLEEQEAGRRLGRAGIERLYGRYGAPLPHGLWTVLRNRPFKNTANTHVLHHARRLFALGEGGAPERIDPHTLASLGADRMNVLGPRDTFSAHPKPQAGTGRVWNFGITYDMSLQGMRARLRFYCMDTDGSVQTRGDTWLPFPGMVHDFCLTPTKAVVVLSPTTFPKVPVAWLTGKSTLGRMMQWRPHLGTRIGVFDLKTGEMRWHKTEPMVTQHTVNAWDEGDDVMFDVGDDEGPERWLRWYDVLQGEVFPRRLPRLRRFRVNPERGVEALYHPVAEMEFPTVDPRYAGRRHQHVFGVTWDEREPFFGTPCKVNVKTGQKHHARLLDGEFSGEPVLVNKKGHHAEGDVWMLCMVMCTKQSRQGADVLPAGRTELQIFDGHHPDRGPVARCVLPQVVPYGFHGTAVANKLLGAGEAA